MYALFEIRDGTDLADLGPHTKVDVRVFLRVIDAVIYAEPDNGHLEELFLCDSEGRFYRIPPFDNHLNLPDEPFMTDPVLALKLILASFPPTGKRFK
jgi:hypothetical protein